MTTSESDNFAVVTSPSDQRVSLYRSIKDAQCRTRGQFLVESERVLERCAELDISFVSVLVSNTREVRCHGVLERLDCPVFVASEVVVNDIIGFPLHRGLLAVARRPVQPALPDLLAKSQTVVVLENVVDPDNIGAILRHCAAFGADALVLSAHCGDPLYRKAVRSSMGWALEVPWTRATEDVDLVDSLHRAGYETLAFTPSGKMSIHDVPRSEHRLALLFGSESDGLLENTMATARSRVRIPIRSRIDSLNVATTAALAMFNLFPEPRHYLIGD